MMKMTNNHMMRITDLKLYVQPFVTNMKKCKSVKLIYHNYHNVASYSDQTQIS